MGFLGGFFCTVIRLVVRIFQGRGGSSMD